MAFCRHCGAELPEGTAFCPKCGTKVDGAAPAAAQTNTSGAISSAAKKEKKGGFGKVLGIAVIAVAAVGAFLYFKGGSGVSIGGTTVDVEAYTSYIVDGFDGAGKIAVDVDHGAIKDVISNGSKDISDNDLYTLVDSIKVTPEVSEGLTEGQEINVKVTYNSTIAEENKVKFKNTEWKYKISGLEQTTEINPFDYVEVAFSGVTPSGTVKYDASTVNSQLGKLNYEFDRFERLSNGETVTLKCVTDEDRLLSMGYKLTETSRTYNVDTLDEFISDPGNLDATVLGRMKKDAEGDINANLSELRARNVSFTDIKYEGAFAVTQDNFKDWGVDNFVVLVYSTTVSCTLDANEYGYFEATDGYIPVVFEDVKKFHDGTTDYAKHYLSNGDSTIYAPRTMFKFKGYTDGTRMYTDLARGLQGYSSVYEDALANIVK